MHKGLLMNNLTVNFTDFGPAYQELKNELDAAYQKFMLSGWYVLGPEVTAFENEYATYCEAKHCVGVGHGLDALHLALRAVGVQTGDEVIVPSNTYIATWLAVTQAGAVPVPVEPDEATYNINPLLIPDAITARTKAILAVNLYGQPCDYDVIRNIAKEHGLRFIIDNAQAHGARYKGKRVGGLAEIECHSFYPTKNLGAFGEAGAITTNDPGLADAIRVLRNYGSRIRYHNEVQGYNSRLDELQAAFLRIKLRRLDEWNKRRRDIAGHYREALKDVEGALVLPHVPECSESVWHLFVVRHAERDKLKELLSESGIGTLIHYPIPPHLSGAYREGGNGGATYVSFPIAERLASTVLSLPLHPQLTGEQTQKVSTAVREAVGVLGS
jgi:dTDP-4-amino-4,6-dideoxygalactose transaminase